jgi:hypothetical protein
MKKFVAFVYRTKVISTGEGAWLEVKARSLNHARKLLENAILQPHDIEWQPNVEVEVSEEDGAAIDSIEVAPDEGTRRRPKEMTMHPSKITQLRVAMRALPDDVRDEIVAQLHQLAGLIAFRDMDGVLKLIQDLDRIFEPNDE